MQKMSEWGIRLLSLTTSNIYAFTIKKTLTPALISKELIS